MRCLAFRRNIRIYIRVVAVVLAVSVIALYHGVFVFTPEDATFLEAYKDWREEENDPGQVCQFPAYHPFEESVSSYFSSPRPIRCRRRISSLTFIDRNGFLRFNVTALAESGYSVDSLSCFYQEINRIPGNDKKVSYGEERVMTGHDKLRTDFVYVACRRFSWFPNVYSTYHAFAQKNRHIRTFRDETEVGVAVVGLDSVSRLNFMRQLPHTYSAITSSLGGVVLKGFNKVGENTFPNLMAMLSGRQPDSKWSKSTFDDWPFIWNALRDQAVATLYGEDCSHIMTFSWWGDGFNLDPTTHYFRPFWLAVDSSSLAAFSSPMCLGSVPKHKIYFDYLKSFLRTYQQHPVFMFSLENEPSHDYLNTVGVVDDDFEEFLRTSYYEGLFNRTVLFVLSDHGHRFDNFRKTKQGKVEDRMPMVSVILPDWFSNLHPHIRKALQINSKRLTSTYDLYSTFVDIFRGCSARHDCNDDTFSGATYNFQKPVFGTSLFRPIGLQRTCAEAGIPEMYCVCKEETTKMRANDAIVEASAKILENHLNHEVLEADSSTWNETINKYLATRNKNVETVDLSAVKQCAKLVVTVEESEMVAKSNSRRIVHLVFKTSPGNGLFEGRVQWPSRDRIIDGEIHEDIIRINRYGSDSNCLNHLTMTLLPLVRSVCYCT